MSFEVVDSVIARVRDKSLRDDIRQFAFVFHGGEPLLAGEEFFRYFVEEARRRLLPEIAPTFVIQTNATLLDDHWCELLAELNVGIGISLDGPQEVNDRRRVDHAGRGSYQEAWRGLQTAFSCRSLVPKPGILTVIDVESDPLLVYNHFKELNVPAVDFLLPEATHDTLPPGVLSPGDETRYADWLVPIFDQWFHESPVPFSIRLFETILTLVLGGATSLDAIGVNRNEILVIETDGGIEPVGSLKICGNGFTKIGANVLTDDLDDALNVELAQLYHLSGERLCQTCMVCPVHEVCGGGYLPHRYSRQGAFDNPSVYCHDLLKLITHIQNAFLDELLPSDRAKLAVQRLSYAEAVHFLSTFRECQTFLDAGDWSDKVIAATS